MKVKTVTCYECPACGCFINEEDLVPMMVERYQCGELYKDRDEAKECCKE